jgi:Lrp/AsnC family transcriptional regulator, leucine-responsive regulatory protein
MVIFRTSAKDGGSMKRVRHVNGGLDDVDARILRTLAADARMPMKELARTVGLSAPSAAERVRRLEEVGIIQGYTVRVDPRALGLPLAVYVRVRPMPGELAHVARLLASKPEIVLCDRVTGDDCFIAKAFVESVDDLERLLDDILPFATTNTSLVQSSPVASRLPEIPLGAE